MRGEGGEEYDQLCQWHHGGWGWGYGQLWSLVSCWGQKGGGGWVGVEGSTLKVALHGGGGGGGMWSTLKVALHRGGEGCGQL